MTGWDRGRIIHSSKVGILEPEKSFTEWYDSRTDREWVDHENENILEPIIGQLGQSTACRQYGREVDNIPKATRASSYADKYISSSAFGGTEMAIIPSFPSLTLPLSNFPMPQDSQPVCISDKKD